MISDIQTARLTLRSMDRRVITACMAGELDKAGVMLGITIPDELLGHPSSLSYTQKQLDADPLYLPWGARAIVLGQTMIGLIRFHSRPGPEYLREYAPDCVELGYRIFTSYRRQGFAFEAVEGMIRWAKSEFDTHHFIASIAPENLPSLQLAARLGFKKIGELVDEIDGIEHIYSLKV
jgi:ribosomal-protein-alanine N-acetyltransferase